LLASPATVFWVLLGAFFCFHQVVLQSVEERAKIVQDVRPATRKRELVLLRRSFEAVRSIGLFWTNERVFAMAITMKVVPYIGFIVLVMVFGSAIFGTLIRRKLPESHLSDETQSVVRLVMGVVGTLTALVLGLLVATASGTFNTRNQEITQLSSKVIQLARLLQHYGPEADGERDLLRLYTYQSFRQVAAAQRRRIRGVSRGSSRF
jgi:hypothetical protein